MNKKQFIELFKKDCECYDIEQKELNAILSSVDFKLDERLIDIGGGVGRLALPLSKYVEVIAIDPNETLLNEIKDSKIETINIKIENYLPKQKFDYALIAWPQFENYEVIFNHVKTKILKENGKLIVLKSKQHSLREITKQLFPELFTSGKGFLKILPQYFNIEKEKVIETQQVYSSEDSAFKLMKFELEVFYGKKLDKEQKIILLKFLKEKEKLGKVYLNAKIRVILCNAR